MSLSRRTLGKTQTHDVGWGIPDASVVRLPFSGQVLKTPAAHRNSTVSPDLIAASSGVGIRCLADTHPRAMHEVSTE